MPAIGDRPGACLVERPSNEIEPSSNEGRILPPETSKIKHKERQTVMAKVTLSSSLMDAHGKMGNVVFRKHGDEHIMAHTPIVGDHVPTPGQAAQQQRFKLAAIYGSAVLADPAKKEVYAAKAKQKGITVFALCIADFLHTPSMDNIDLSTYTGKPGETITIQASDEVAVAGVAVRILDTDRRGAGTRTGPSQRRQLESTRPPLNCRWASP